MRLSLTSVRGGRMGRVCPYCNENTSVTCTLIAMKLEMVVPSPRCFLLAGANFPYPPKSLLRLTTAIQDKTHTSRSRLAQLIRSFSVFVRARSFVFFFLESTRERAWTCFSDSCIPYRALRRSWHHGTSRCEG